MGYAISIDSAKPIIEKLIRGEQVVHPRLGVGVRDGGALIVEVSPDSPAAAAGLEAGDIIVEFEGQEISSAEALWQAIQSCQVGDEVEITYIRDGNVTTTSTVLE
jgi:putative serine protease PepD